MTHDPGAGTPMSERMQSLLSRAVEDQLSEQRSLAGALADVRTQIATLSQSLVTSQQSQAAPDAASLGALTVELREAMRRTGDRLDTIARMVAQRGEDLASLQSSLSGFGEQLRVHGEGMTGVAATLSTVAHRVDGIATYLGDRSAGDPSRSAAIEQRLVTLQTDMTALGSYVAGLAESAGGRGEGDDLDGRIRAIVAGALVGTERRLAAHVDETVLALAEALLRPHAVAQGSDQPGDTDQHAGTDPLGADAQLTSLTARAEAAAASTVAPEGPGPVPVSGHAPDQQPTPVAASSEHPGERVAAPLVDPSAIGAAPPAAVADEPVARTGGQDSPGEANGQPQNGPGPRVPPPWTTVDSEDAERRRGWFRSRD